VIPRIKPANKNIELTKRGRGRIAINRKSHGRAIKIGATLAT
jgi:hypothetical protein